VPPAYDAGDCTGILDVVNACGLILLARLEIFDNVCNTPAQRVMCSSNRIPRPGIHDLEKVSWEFLRKGCVSIETFQQGAFLICVADLPASVLHVLPSSARGHVEELSELRGGVFVFMLPFFFFIGRLPSIDWPSFATGSCQLVDTFRCYRIGAWLQLQALRRRHLAMYTNQDTAPGRFPGMLC